MVPAFYINLDRVPERAAFMEGQLARAGLTDRSARMPAVDARRAPLSPRYVPHRWGPRWEMTASEVACFESHRALWQRIVDERIEAAMILEDDMLLSARLDAHLSAVPRAGIGWDVVKLDGVPQPARFGPAVALPGVQGVLRPIRQTVASAGCYLLSRAAAAALLARSERYCDHLDDFVFDPTAGLRLWQCMPALAVQTMFADRARAAALDVTVSTSERTADRAVNHPKSRGPFAYRLAKELRRTARKTAWRFGADAALRRAGGMVGIPDLVDDLGEYRGS